MKKTISLFLLILISMPIFAQGVEMADQFRAEGKIYVVIAVMLLILFGVFAYLIRLDLKLRKIEGRKS